MTMELARPPFEHVVLVDEDNRPIGTARKSEVHHVRTPLHRGFSVFLFDRAGRTLLQQRSFGKVTWPGVWSNACCGHPQLAEPTLDSMRRRLSDELGLTAANLTIVLPDYRYRFTRQGVVENEFCPVAVGVTDEKPRPNPDEVHAVQWRAWDQFLDEVAGGGYSEWCVEEAALLTANPTFQQFLAGLDDGAR